MLLVLVVLCSHAMKQCDHHLLHATVQKFHGMATVLCDLCVVVVTRHRTRKATQDNQVQKIIQVF